MLQYPNLVSNNESPSLRLTLPLLLWSAGQLPAAIITIPSSVSGVELPSSDNAPLGASSQRFQQVFDASLLASLTPGDKIYGLTFRIDGGQTSLPAQTVGNYEIRMSQSVNVAGSLSTTFANNHGADQLLVRSGPLTIGAGDFPGGPGPNPFGAFILFNTPYTYIGGPLLLEIGFDSFPNGGRYVDDSGFLFAGAQQLFGSGFGATTADFGSESQAFAMQFLVNVPEPSSLVLFAAGGAALLALGRLRRS